jgi:hypothetical protein
MSAPFRVPRILARLADTYNMFFVAGRSSETRTLRALLPKSDEGFAQNPQLQFVFSAGVGAGFAARAAAGLAEGHCGGVARPLRHHRLVFLIPRVQECVGGDAAAMHTLHVTVILHPLLLLAARATV